ncbi:MAG: cyclase family protein, partial [Pyrinomonadaceae bacterium]
ITHERISVRDCLRDVLITAILISVEPSPLDGEARSETTDRLITKNAVKAAVDELGSNLNAEALIIRTLPNDDSKLERRYADPESLLPEIPPYFSADAMRYLIDLGVKHLLVDIPSIDRVFDEGKLVNHRIFWNVEDGSFETSQAMRLNSTITELIYVRNDVADGEYLLNLQIAPFSTDASPSRPMLLKILS